MVHDPADDFDHLAYPDGHRLRRHVLYRMTRSTPPNYTIHPTAFGGG